MILQGCEQITNFSAEDKFLISVAQLLQLHIRCYMEQGWQEVLLLGLWLSAPIHHCCSSWGCCTQHMDGVFCPHTQPHSGKWQGPGTPPSSVCPPEGHCGGLQPSGPSLAVPGCRVPARDEEGLHKGVLSTVHRLGEPLVPLAPGVPLGVLLPLFLPGLVIPICKNTRYRNSSSNDFFVRIKTLKILKTPHGLTNAI